MKYANDVRTKANVYRRKRGEMDDLKAENVILAGTVTILSGQWNELKQQIVRLVWFFLVELQLFLAKILILQTAFQQKILNYSDFQGSSRGQCYRTGRDTSGTASNSKTKDKQRHGTEKDGQKTER